MIEAELSPAEFYEIYGDDFEELLKIPLVVKCLSHRTLVPYEYSDSKSLRPRRSIEDMKLSNCVSKKMMCYFLRSGVPVEILNKMRGGNPISYVSTLGAYRNN